MLAPTKAPIERSYNSPPLRRARRPPPGRPTRRWRRVAALAAGLCLIPAFVSYVQAVTTASNATLGIRTVEWLRDNGARGLVNKVESIYYSLNAPAKGGPALRALPRQAGVASARRPSPSAPRYYRPPRISPLIHPALRGEGVWHATFAGGGAQSAGAGHQLPQRSVDYPQMVAGVAWIDTT